MPKKGSGRALLEFLPLSGWRCRAPTVIRQDRTCPSVYRSEPSTPSDHLTGFSPRSKKPGTSSQVIHPPHL